MLVNEIITQSELSEGPNDPHIFKAIFLAGGPGSGKSYVASKLLNMADYGLKTINSDDIYEYLAKKATPELDLSDPEQVYSDRGQDIRNRAKQITMSKQASHLDGRLGVVIDGTGKDPSKVQKQSDDLKSLGYDTMMLFVNTSEEIAQDRNKMRPRRLPDEVISKMWKQVQDNIMKFQQIFGSANFHVVDNSGGLEDPERKENFNNVEKAIRAFINAPATSRIARAWLADQQQKRVKSDK
jgi:predicted kinase